MRSIPASLQAKLQDRFKASATGSEPHIKLVATQMSTNTLLSEPIHKDVTPDFGDVAIRQMEGDDEPYCAYAICIDEGVAKVYRRLFPASMEYIWEYVLTVGPAEDAAIEFDGTWTVDPTNTWYYLKTQEYPYIFTVEDGDLYCQHWNDTDTRVLLAEDVEQISVCKGWKNSIDIELDQGLIVGYIRDGEVFYRALCTQEDESIVWENETHVTSMGQDNDTLSVIRTNDFRVGFLTEKSGEIYLALSTRTYAGMSVRPEALHINPIGDVRLIPVGRQYGFLTEHASVSVQDTFFNFYESEAVISVETATKRVRQDEFTAYGIELELSEPLYGTVTAALLAAVTVTASNGSRTTNVTVTNVTYNASSQSFIFTFSADVSRTLSLTITTGASATLWYYDEQGQRWTLPALTATLPAETYNYYTYNSDYASASSSAVLQLLEVNFIPAGDEGSLLVSSSAVMALQPSSILPI